MKTTRHKQKGVFDAAMGIGLATLVVLMISQHEDAKMEERHQQEMEELRTELELQEDE